jgi:peroxiredoxin
MTDATPSPDTVVQPPAPFPVVHFLDADGRAVTSAAALAGGPCVVFYRGARCLHCTTALRAYRHMISDLAARGTKLVTVSPQHPDRSPSLRPLGEPTFAVLLDPGRRTAKALGIMTVADYGGAAVPMPTVAIVDTAGMIRWLDVRPDHTTRTEPDEILDALDTHLPARRPRTAGYAV